MRKRSWVAGLTGSAGIVAVLGVGSSAILGQSAGKPATEKPRPARVATKEKAPSQASAGNIRPVKLFIKVAGLGADGCEVEIKPANPSCRFRTLTKHVPSSGELEGLLIKDLELRGADRYCSFAITVNEPGQKPRTIHRGFRLPARPGPDEAAQEFVCWLSSPSKLARMEESTTRR